MDDWGGRRRAADENRIRDRGGALRARPDRVALWAVGLALILIVAAAVSAQASTGGVAAEDDGSGADDGGGGTVECRDVRFGGRVLERPDCGEDVRTLNWLLRSLNYQRDVTLGQRFNQDTAATVRKLQRRNDLAVDGVLRKRPRRELIRTMNVHRATWYGPGFFGNRTACGQTLRKRTRGVAHRRLPCGTRVVIRYKGSLTRTRVIDRGPYAHGANWDLTQRTARDIGFTYTDNVRVARVR